MKKILLICLTTLIVGCEKQPEKVDNSSIQQQFDESDKRIEGFLDILDDRNADKDLQRKVLCSDYPKVYEQEYLPALLKLSNDESKEKLIDDFKITTEYYSQKLKIVCE